MKPRDPVSELQEILQALGAKKTLDRERALAQLVARISTLQRQASTLAALWRGLLELVHNAGAWESRLGGLMGAKALIRATSGADAAASSAQASGSASSTAAAPSTCLPCPQTLPSAPLAPRLAAPTSNTACGGSDSSKQSLPPGGTPALPADSMASVLEACLKLLEDEEPRVRVAVGEVLGELARVQGPAVWLRAQPAVMASIRDNYDRDGEGEKREPATPLPSAPATAGKGGANPPAGPGPHKEATGPLSACEQGSNSSSNDCQPGDGDQRRGGNGTDWAGSGAGASQGAAGGGGFLSELLSTSYKPRIPGVGEMRHGTEGWRCLETSMRTMVAILDGAGAAVAPQITPGLVDLVARSMHHPNRYVREAAHAGACALFRAMAGAEGQRHGPPPMSSQPEGQHADDCPPADPAGPNQQQPQQPQQQMQLCEQQREQEQQQQQHEIEQQQQQEQHVQQGGWTQGCQGAGWAAPPGCCYSLLGLGAHLAPFIADGLTDNWSQVRYCGCVSARTLLLLVLQANQSFESLMPVLLPPLCLNRYYVAEGVRSYAQETWQLVMGGRGRVLVAKHIQQVTDYYVAQSKAVHHGVREAACACIAELAEKVEQVAVEPHMARLLHCMLLCFKDMAWPVRDAACVACGRCVLCYPEVCKPRLQELLDLWCAHLWDNVQSVRENSARALADAIRGVPEGLPLDTVHQAIRDLLPKAYEQRVDSRGRQHERDSSRSTSRATHPAASPATTSTMLPQATSKPPSKPSSRPRSFGRPRTASPSAGRPLSPARMMEQALKNDPLFCPSEEDMGLFGAGAAARFSTAFYIKGDGCMDFGFSRDQEPWEASDGAVFMIRELACVRPEACTQHLQPLVDLVTAASLNNFDGATKLRETVWRCLPTLAKAIGKSALKRHLLEGLLDPLIGDLTCSTQLTEAAAGKAAGALRDMLGPSIFMARLSPKQAAALQSSPHVPPSAMRLPSNNDPSQVRPECSAPAILGPRLGLGRG